MSTYTDTTPLPFAPLTVTEIHRRQDELSWWTVCELTLRDQGHYSASTLRNNSRRALTLAREAHELHRAAVARLPRT